MHKCILARTQKMRQSDEASARHEKVSNHRCQLPTKTKTSNYVLPKREAAKGGGGNRSSIWRKTKCKCLSRVHD